MTPVRVGIDIGGTFTDLVAVDADGRVHRAKTATTPRALDDAVLTVLADTGLPPETVTDLVHGSTVVVNAVTERKGARTGLLTTSGFADVLEIARTNRPALYDLSYRKPPPLVPRRLRLEADERIDHHGNVLRPLDPADVREAAEQFRAAGVGAVAVCFLHSWLEPDHEQRAAELLRTLLPDVEVVASHELSRQWREYERTSTAVLSAYVQPTVAGYLGVLGERLAGTGVTGSLYAMQSSGGVAPFDVAARAPITLLESGPVAGVTAAVALGRQLGHTDVLSFDVGGTTAKTSAVRDGRVRINTLHHVERTPSYAGYPVQAPVVDIVEVGAGGGSIVEVDAAGRLHVGPRSAGAEPGPVCYGRGGTAPTVTDANLLCGRLDPDNFLGGRMTLDVDAAEKAFDALDRQLRVGARDAARGALRYAVATMANALRLVTSRRGHDPRDFTFVAYGGNGPLHAALVARELGITRIVVPPGPGHFSAYGMLVGDLTAHAVQTHVAPLDTDVVTALLDRVTAEASQRLAAQAESVRRFVELRYRGQEHTLEIAVPDAVGAALVDRLRADFDRASQEAYAFTLDAPLEVVAARVEAVAHLDHPTAAAEADLDGAAIVEPTSRLVDFDEAGGRREASVVDRRSLTVDVELPGPCVVEEPAATTLVLPGQSVRADRHGNLLLVDHHD
ncbi:MAG: hydantoinase/oxoprolinase family protein [Streptosporangiales bacterium]|nr:hydantoinase/oxoprolinase family protein [Streptosporangiales bacterium]